MEGYEFLPSVILLFSSSTRTASITNDNNTKGPSCKLLSAVDESGWGSKELREEAEDDGKNLAFGESFN